MKETFILLLLFPFYIFSDSQNYQYEKKQSDLPIIADMSFPITIINNSIHSIVGISQIGDYIMLEDGSRWHLNKKNLSDAFLWNEQDPIIIFENDYIRSWFFGFKYKMINRANNGFIEVNLIQGPDPDNICSLKIKNLNTNQLLLSDESIFECDLNQKDLLEKFQTDDLVIVGSNKKDFDTIILNIRLNETIKANRINQEHF